MDEIPMSLVAYLYHINVCRLANISSRKPAYLLTMACVWTAYIQYKVYPLFVAFFIGQLGMPVYMLCFLVRKNPRQIRHLTMGSRFLVFSVCCWIWERYLYNAGHCPTGFLDPRYYLHSYWHVGMAAAHYHFMRCMDR
jgi:hypothetical protein